MGADLGLAGGLELLERDGRLVGVVYERLERQQLMLHLVQQRHVALQAQFDQVEGVLDQPAAAVDVDGTQGVPLADLARRQLLILRAHSVTQTDHSKVYHWIFDRVLTSDHWKRRL